MSIRLRMAPTLVIVAVLLSGCNFPTVSEAYPQPAPQGKLRAWVDAPLNGTLLPLNVPYPIVCHGADPGGIAAVELSLNGSAAETFSASEQDSMLLTASYNWVPATPGRTILECRAQNASGAWSEPAQSVVMVEEGTPTPSPTPTPTGTPTPTATLTPTPIQQLGFAGPPVFRPSQINLPYDCPSSSLTAEIKVTSTQGIKVVVLFFRATDKGFAEHSEWASIAMNPVGAETYRATFDPVKVGGFMPWLSSHWSTSWEGWLATQFVIQDTHGGYTRTEVDSLVKIGGCH